ncbi:MAG: hypothetical protein WC250_02590 [Candidatus Paceibacterota bacterium]|jgi:hypothetical protein
MTSKLSNFQTSKLITRASRRSGFTMLFAVLISGVLMAIGISIFNISIKEVRLSSTARDSNLAFYASDTGRECAIYWDMAAKKKLNGTDAYGFATSTDNSVAIISADQFSCGGQIKDFQITVRTSDKATTKFTIQLGGDFDLPYCADVAVTKVKNYDTDTFDTNISAQGHNTCDLTNPVIIERGTEANYSQ